jgi:hypothetical protein
MVGQLRVVTGAQIIFSIKLFKNADFSGHVQIVHFIDFDREIVRCAIKLQQALL